MAVYSNIVSHESWLNNKAVDTKYRRLTCRWSWYKQAQCKWGVMCNWEKSGQQFEVKTGHFSILHGLSPVKSYKTELSAVVTGVHYLTRSHETERSFQRFKTPLGESGSRYGRRRESTWTMFWHTNHVTEDRTSARVCAHNVQLTEGATDPRPPSTGFGDEVTTVNWFNCVFPPIQWTPGSASTVHLMAKKNSLGKIRWIWLFQTNRSLILISLVDLCNFRVVYCTTLCTLRPVIKEVPWKNSKRRCPWVEEVGSE